MRTYLASSLAGGLLLAAAWVATHPNPTAPVTGFSPDCSYEETVARRLPGSPDALGTAVACLGLRHAPERARTLLGRATPDVRRGAVNVAFYLVHPQADAGDDLGTFEVMGLVVDEQPDNYEALYHAGMGAFAAGRRGTAKAYLERFVDLYRTDDGYRQSALHTLEGLR